MIIVTHQPLNPEEISKKLPTSNNVGSIVLHYAVVKPKVEGKDTDGIRFGASSDIEEEMRLLESKLRDSWEVKDIILARRLGTLQIGDIISVAVVAADGREAAFGACQQAVELFRTMKSIRKEEMLK